MQFGSKPLFENTSVTSGGGKSLRAWTAPTVAESPLYEKLGGDPRADAGNAVSIRMSVSVSWVLQDQFAFETFTVLLILPAMGHGEPWEVKQERDRICAPCRK